MDKINRVLLVFGIYFLISNNLLARDIVISENFLKHEYCKNVKNISFSSYVNSKKTMFELLKKEIQNNNANAAINTEYSVNMFDKRSISAIITNCDIDKSPELFVKSDNIVNKDESYLSNYFSDERIFTSISIVFDDINTKVEDISRSIIQEKFSPLGVGFKIGIKEKNYRYYANIKVASGVNILGAIDYIYNYKNKVNLIAGVNLGMSSYRLIDDDSTDGFVKGFQFAIAKKRYELGFQYLDANFNAKVNNKDIKIKNIKNIYISYQF